MERGARHNRQASGRITLPLGVDRRYAVLANARGESELGAYYKTMAGAAGGQRQLGADNIARLGGGNREFLQVASGRRRLLRTLENDGAWSYTAAGKHYFATHEYAEYVVHVPVRIETHTGPRGGRVRHDLLP